MSLLSDSIALYKREMLIFRANLRTNVIRSAIFPLFILLIFGSTSGSITNVPVAVVNYANNAQASQFINSLQLQSTMVVQSVTNQNQALDMLSAGQIDFVIIILPDFPSKTSAPAVQVYYTNLQFSTTAEILPIIQQRVEQYSAPGSFQEKFYQPSTTPSSTSITAVNSASGSQSTFIFAGVIGMVLVFSALFAGGLSLIQDRNSGIMKSYLVTPINKSSILFGR